MSLGRHCWRQFLISSLLSFRSQRVKGKGGCTNVRDLDGRDLGCRLKLLWTRHEAADHGTLYLQSDLRDTVGSSHLLLLTLTADPEQENQDATEGPKKALIFTTESGSAGC